MYVNARKGLPSQTFFPARGFQEESGVLQTATVGRGREERGWNGLRPSLARLFARERTPGDSLSPHGLRIRAEPRSRRESAVDAYRLRQPPRCRTSDRGGNTHETEAGQYGAVRLSTLPCGKAPPMAITP